MISVTDLAIRVDGVLLPSSPDAAPAPVVIGEGIVIEWGRETVLDHVGATSLTFGMIRPATSRMPLPRIGSEVTLHGTRTETYSPSDQFRDPAPVLLFRGVIDGVTEHPRERVRTPADLTGVTRHTITATDSVGVLQRMKIAAPPWPRETPAARYNRVRSIAGAGHMEGPLTVTTDGMPGGEVIPLDVDNRSAWEVLEQTMQVPHGYLVTNGTGRVDLWGVLEPNRRYVRRNVPQIQVAEGSGYGTALLEAGGVEDIERSEAWDTGISTVTVAQHFTTQNVGVPPEDYAEAERSVTLGRRAAPGQALQLASHRVEYTAARNSQELTALDVSGAIYSPAVALAQSILTATTDLPPSLPPLRINLSRYPHSRDRQGREFSIVSKVIEAGGARTIAGVYIVGLPYGIPAGHVLLGGRIELAVDTTEQWVELTLAPHQMIGTRPLTFAAMQPYQDVTFERLGDVSSADIYNAAWVGPAT